MLLYWGVTTNMCIAGPAQPVRLVWFWPDQYFGEKRGVTSCVLFIVLESENIDVCIHACLLSVRAG